MMSYINFDDNSLYIRHSGLSENYNSLSMHSASSLCTMNKVFTISSVADYES